MLKRALFWKYSFRILVALLLLAPHISHAVSDEARVLSLLEKTRHLTMGGHSMTPGLDYVYPDSLFEMAQRLSENDIPVLLKLLEKDNEFPGKYSDRKAYNKNYKIAEGASFGLAALCGRSISPIMMAVKANRLDANMGVKNDPLHWIDAFSQVPGGCSAQDAQRAKAAQQKIAILNDARQAKVQLEYEQRKAVEDDTRNRINSNGMKMLDPVAAENLTLEERKEVFASSVKSMGLDKDQLTPEQKVLVQKMYNTMVLQQGRQTSNQ